MNFDKRLKASFTVEAAIIVSAVLIYISIFFGTAMKLHDICYGNSVIAEALEVISQLKNEELNEAIQLMKGYTDRKTESMLYQKSMNVKIEKENRHVVGCIDGREYSNIQKVKLYQPEAMVRRLTLTDKLK